MSDLFNQFVFDLQRFASNFATISLSDIVTQEDAEGFHWGEGGALVTDTDTTTQLRVTYKEDDENAEIKTITAVSFVSLGDSPSHTLTITGDDTKPTITNLGSKTVTFGEGEDAKSFTFSNATGKYSLPNKSATEVDKDTIEQPEDIPTAKYDFINYSTDGLAISLTTRNSSVTVNAAAAAEGVNINGGEDGEKISVTVGDAGGSFTYEVATVKNYVPTEAYLKLGEDAVSTGEEAVATVELGATNAAGVTRVYPAVDEMDTSAENPVASISVNNVEYFVTQGSGQASFFTRGEDGIDGFVLGAEDDAIRLDDKTAGGGEDFTIYKAAATTATGTPSEFSNVALDGFGENSTAVLTKNASDFTIDQFSGAGAMITIGNVGVELQVIGEGNTTESITFTDSATNAITDFVVAQGDIIVIETTGTVKDTAAKRTANIPFSTGTVTITGDTDGNFTYNYAGETLVLDLEMSANTTFTISATGGAEQVLMPEAAEATTFTFKFGSDEYIVHAGEGAGEGSGFHLTNDAVDGFIFGEEEENVNFFSTSGIPDGFTWYTSDDEGVLTEIEDFPEVETSGTIAVGYTPDTELTFTVDKNATVTLGDQEIDLSGMASTQFVQIQYDPDLGKITGIVPAKIDTAKSSKTYGSATTDGAAWVAGTKIKVIGDVAESEDEGISFDNGDSTVAISTGNYTFEVDSKTVATHYITLTDGTCTVYGTGDAKKVFFGASTGTITDNNSGAELTYETQTNKAYMSAEGGLLTGFVFVDAGDALTLTEALPDDFALKYDVTGTATTEKTVEFVTTPEVTTGEDGYKIEMTQAWANDKTQLAKFEINGLTGETTVAFGEAPSFVFDEALTDGSVIFTGAAAGTITPAGIESDADVEMTFTAATALAKGAFTINDPDGESTLDISAIADKKATYVAETNGLVGVAANATVVNAGTLEAIYAPVSDASAAITFGTTDKTAGTTAVKFSVTTTGEDAETLPYFVVDGANATGFVFNEGLDTLSVATSIPDGFQLYNLTKDNGFDAPDVYQYVIASGDHSTKTTKGYDITKVSEETFSVSLKMESSKIGQYVSIADTAIALKASGHAGTQADPNPSIIFSATDGKLVSIGGLNKAKDSVQIIGATGEILFTDSLGDTEYGTVEITSIDDSKKSSFVYTVEKLEGTTPVATISEVYSGSFIKQVARATEITTFGGASGLGGFSFAGGQKFNLTGTTKNGISFTVEEGDDAIIVGGISDVDASETVEGAFFTEDNDYAFSFNGIETGLTSAAGGSYKFWTDGTNGSLSGLKDGDEVVTQGSVSYFFTDEAGEFTFGTTGMSIAGDEHVKFSVEGDSLTAIGGLSGTAQGDFSDITVNGATIDITGDEDGIKVTGNNDDYASEEGVTKIEGVGGDEVTLTNVGGASQVLTNTVGSFSFAGNEVAFTIEGDSSVTFGMVDGEDAKVESILIDEGTVTGALSGISINGSAIDITNDANNIFSFDAEKKILGGVSAAAGKVSKIKGIGGASFVEIGGGSYTFNVFDRAGVYEFAELGASALVSADGISGLAGIVAGSFSNAWNVNGSAIQITGGDAAVFGDSDEVGLIAIGGGMSVAQADGVGLAVAIGDGKFGFVNGSFSVAGDSDYVEFYMDGQAGAMSVAGLDKDATLRGGISFLNTINGATIDIKGDSSFAVVGASVGIGKIIDLSDGASVINAGGASFAVTDTAGVFTFGGGSAITLYSDVEDLKATFSLNEDSTAKGVSSAENYAVMANNKLFENFKVNGQSIAIDGDKDDLGVAVIDNKVAAIGYVNGDDVKLNKLGGASVVFTDKDGDGKFTFTESNQVFVTAGGNSYVLFGLENDKVTKIENLDGTVTGSFSTAIEVNKAAVQVTGDNEVTVLGAGYEKGITKISGLSAAAGISGIVDILKADKVTAISADGDGTFKFTFAGGESFAVANNGASATEFTFANNVVTAIDGVDEGEFIGGKFDNGIAINGGASIQVKDVDGITVTNAGGSFVVSDLDAESVVKAGTFTAITSSDGEFTDADERVINISGGSATITVVDGKFTAITAGESVALSGNLNGLTIGGESILVFDKNEVLRTDDGLYLANGTLSGINDGDRVQKADGATTIHTTANGTFKFGGATGGTSFTVSGDENGVDFNINNGSDVVVTSVTGLDEGAELKGSLLTLEEVNGVSFNVEGDKDFSVIGGKSGVGIGSISNLSDGAKVVNAGGASFAVTDTEGTFTFGGTSIQLYALGAIEDDSEIGELDGEKLQATFTLEGNSATGVTSEEDYGVVADSKVFENFTVNGKEISIDGDENEELGVSVFEGKVFAIGFVGGESVTLNNVGGASFVFTDSVGTFNFTKSDQKFVMSEGASNAYFELNGDDVVEVGDVVGAVEGVFEGNVSVNGSSVAIEETASDDEGAVKVYATEDGITKIENVGGVYVAIENVGGAKEVVTNSEGIFNFEGNEGAFIVAGDSSVTFGMVEDEAAKVAKIDNLAVDAGQEFAGVYGDLNGIAINGGASLDIAGDDEFIYAVAGESAAVFGINDSGDGVEINSIGNANALGVQGDGEFTFNNILGFSGVYGVSGAGEGYVGFLQKEISGMSGTVTGNFTDEITVNDAAIQVTGDELVGVVLGESGVSEITGLDNEATVAKADGVTLATTSELGGESATFTFGNGEFKVVGDEDGVQFILDGETNVVGVSGLDEDATLTGAINGLAINGATVEIANDDNFGVVGTGDGIKAITDFSGGASIVSGGKAEKAYTDLLGGSSAVFGFEDGSTVKVYGDDDVVFSLDKETGAVVGISGLVGAVEADTTLLGNIPVNGKQVAIVGDENDLGIATFGDEDFAIGKVGGASGVTIQSAAGASLVFTDQAGNFNIGGKEFITSDEEIVFSLDGDENVTAIDELSPGEFVEGDFQDEIAVNDDAIQVLGDEGVIVFGATSGVSAIALVNAGATVAAWGQATEVGAIGDGEFTFGAQSGTVFGAADQDSLFSFLVDENGVTGVKDFDNGALELDAATTALDVNVETYPEQKLTFESTENISLSVADQKVVGVAGVTGSVSGLVDAVVNANGPIAINGINVDITDADENFNVEIADGGLSTITDVTGDATVNVANATVSTDELGNFVIGGASYSFTDEDGNAVFTTDADKQLVAVDELNGTMVDADGNVDVTVNDKAIAIAGNSTPATIGTDGENITSVEGLTDGAEVTGELENATVQTAGDEDGDGATTTVNGVDYKTTFDVDGVAIEGVGNNVISDLDDDARLEISEAGDYTINGTALTVGEGDTVIGANGKTYAYIYSVDEMLVRKNTPIEEIETAAGLDFTGSESFGGPRDGEDPEPLTKAESDALFADDSTADLDQKAEIWVDNQGNAEEQELDLSDYDGAKKVTLYEGPQSVTFNDEGGNEAVVDAEATGEKEITLGDGGDMVIVDGAAGEGNEVNIIGGEGDDSIFVRDAVATTIDMSEGGKDVISTESEANARVTLEGYDVTEGGGIMVQEFPEALEDAIEEGVVSFGDGVVSINGDKGTSEITVPQDANGASFVNLFNPFGDEELVGFADSEGGVVDGSKFDQDVILVGNDGEDSLKGGDGNDTFYASDGDTVVTGEGNDAVKFDDEHVDQAKVEVGDGRTSIEGNNSGFETGDILEFDYSEADTIELTDDGKLVVKGEDFYIEADAEVEEGNYVEQLINDTDSGKEFRAAVGGKSATLKVAENELERANAYLGMGDAPAVVDFSEYTGPVTVDLEGDLYNSNINGEEAFFNEGINGLMAGSGDAIFKGSDRNETFIAGTGNSSLYGDGGNNLLVGQAGNDDKVGQTTFFILGNANGAANTITGFEFVDDDNFSKIDDVTTADKIEVQLDNNYVSALKVVGDDVYFEVTDRENPNVKESALIVGGAGENIRIGDDIVAQVADTELTFDGKANFFHADGANATVTVAEGLDSVNLWLLEPETGYNFEGDIKVIDARANGGTAELGGNEKDNVIYAGSGNTSLWGGGGDDTLVGGSGSDSFYYNFGEGNDVIEDAGSGDTVILGNMTLEDITGIDTATNVVLTMRDGAKLTVEDGANVDFKVGDATYALDSNREFVQK